MALPTLQKTWQITPNLFSPSSGRDGHCATILLEIKNALIGFASNPLTVAGSSNGSTAGMDATDRWVTWPSLTWAVAGDPHSWIVLERVDGIQICLDLNRSFETQMDVVVSLSGAFTGGTTSNRPTATDEFLNILWDQEDSVSGGYVWIDYSDNEATCRFHVWNSTDGLIQRVIGFQHTATAFFWRWEVIRDAPTGFSPPFVASMIYSTVVGYEALASGWFVDIWGFGEQFKKGAFRANSTNSLLYNTTQRSEWPETAWGVVKEDIDGVCQMTEVVYISRTTNTRGILGRAYDLWITNEAVLKNGDSFPDDPDNRQFVVAGCVALPWTGDDTLMLVG